MKKYLFLFLIAIYSLISSIVFAQTNPEHVKVKGYYKSNGTYVQPYYRTAPNSTNKDNFSTKGNVNPYTGKPGYIQPDSKSSSIPSKNTNYYNNKSYSTPTYTPYNNGINNRNTNRNTYRTNPKKK